LITAAALPDELLLGADVLLPPHPAAASAATASGAASTHLRVTARRRAGVRETGIGFSLPACLSSAKPALIPEPCSKRGR
jgi:hypothetical protein